MKGTVECENGHTLGEGTDEESTTSTASGEDDEKNEVSDVLDASLRDLICTESWDDVLKRLHTEEGRSEAQERSCASRLNDYAIHAACSAGAEGCSDIAPLNVIEALLKVYPEGIRQQDNHSSLPIHVAARDDASLDIVKALLDAYPEAAQQQDSEGNLPLHLAARGSSSVDVIRELLKAHPEGIRQKSFLDGNLPLHCAAGGSRSVDVIGVLIEAFPEGKQQKNRVGNLPIHIAALLTKCVNVIQTLLDAFSEGARRQIPKSTYRFTLHAIDIKRTIMPSRSVVYCLLPILQVLFSRVIIAMFAGNRKVI